MLTASAYACIVQVVHDMKRDSRSVTDERHRAATVLQTTLQHVIPLAEQKMKTTATNLAKQYYDKVGEASVSGREMFHVHSIGLIVHTCIILYVLYK